MKQSQLKHYAVFERLKQEFSHSSFKVGDRLPSERDFAERLSVNIATIRRAFRDLVLAGIVEKRIGSGTYLAQPLQASWQERTVNLLLGRQRITEFDKALERAFLAVTKELGRTGRVIYVDEESYPEVVRSCLCFKQPTIVAYYGGNGELAECPELFVRLSSMSYNTGIPSVLCDDVDVINSQIAHLRSVGCRRIALLSVRETRELQKFQQAVWQGTMGKDYAPELSITAESPDCGPVEAAYEAVNKAWGETSFNGLICLTDELMFGALSALRRNGARVPEDVAVTSIGDTELARFSNPSVTGINPDAEAHIRSAVELLDHNHEHPQSLELMRLLKSRLIVRESTARNHNRQMMKGQKNAEKQ